MTSKSHPYSASILSWSSLAQGLLRTVSSRARDTLLTPLQPSQLLSSCSSLIREWIFPFPAAEMLLVPLCPPAALVSAPAQAEMVSAGTGDAAAPGKTCRPGSQGRWAWGQAASPTRGQTSLF